MSVSEIRENIKQWFDTKLRIDSWDLDHPKNIYSVVNNDQVAANTAIADPIDDFKITKWQDSNTLITTAVFRYYLIYRFNSGVSRHQLPTDDLEDLKEWILFQFASRKVKLSELVLNVEVNDEQVPLFIKRIQGEDSDWLVGITIPLLISFLTDPRNPFDTEEDDSVSVNRIQIDIWKSKIPVITDPDLDSSILSEINNA